MHQQLVHLMGFHMLCLRLPLEIARNSDENVEAVEECLEGYALVNIKHTTDYIDNNPEEPLLKVFTRQSP